jgi:hypothetical protein
MVSCGKCTGSRGHQNPLSSSRKISFQLQTDLKAFKSMWHQNGLLQLHACIGLDRTQLDLTMKDGSKALYFNWIDLAYFDIFILKRASAKTITRKKSLKKHRKRQQ